MEEILTLEVHPAPEIPRHVGTEGQGSFPSGIGCQKLPEFFLKGRSREDIQERIFQFFQGSHEGFRDKASAVLPKPGIKLHGMPPGRFSQMP